jgi:hypothetical protein
MAMVNWAHSFEQALRQAEQEGKLVFLISTLPREVAARQWVP